MILCWGFSIHARRRAQLFVDDNHFEVTIVSNYDYKLDGATNILLPSGKKSHQEANGNAGITTKVRRFIPTPLIAPLRGIAKLCVLAAELRSMAEDLKVLRHTFSAVRPDALLLQTLQYPSFLAYCLSKSTPMIVTFWNGDLTYFAKWTGVEMLIKKRIVVHGLKRAQMLTVNSQTALDAAVKLGADPSKLILIRYPGADLSRFRPVDKKQARKRLNIKSRHVVLCPRGLGRFFNTDVVVEAVSRLLEEFPDLLLLFISGVGGEEEWLKHLSLAKRLGIADKIQWDGHIDWEMMPTYYAAADVMVSVKTADSCPNCMLEAMACGIPVVMSDTSQNREWIRDGENGYLCPPRDADALNTKIRNILKDDGNLVSRFTSLCLKQVRAEADSTLNSARIKNLAAEVALRREGK